ALAEPAVIPFGRHRLTVSVADSARLVGRARRGATAHNERRANLDRLLVRHLLGQLAGRGAAVGDDARADVDEALRADPAFAAAANAMWPTLTPESLLHRFLSSRMLIERAARSLLDADECAALYRPASPRTADVPWTDADVALLDEAAVRLGERSLPRVRRHADDDGDGGDDHWAIERALDDAGAHDPGLRAQLRRRLENEAGPDDDGHGDLATRTFGHVLVDEAQDLSPMQWRMLSRRCPGGSMTIVGDLGQATGSRAPSSWEEVVAQLPRRRDLRVATLTVNYRTPSEVMGVAARVLAAAAPDITPPVPVRQAGVEPVFSRVGAEDLVSATAQAARDERAAVAPGKVGVVAPAGLLPELAAALGPELARTGVHAGVLDAPVALLAPETAKGLEFDSVVVAEPARLVAESPQGLRALYVALTRTTRRLRVVHAEPLPPSLAAGPGPSVADAPAAEPDGQDPAPDNLAVSQRGMLWPRDP
ncbi:MAG: ATP-binding domain-containing protein, partial [Acidimicrobiales bacterium]